MYCEQWTRWGKIELIRKEIYPQIHISVDVNPIPDIIKIIDKYRRENGYPREMIAVVDDGFLTINGKNAGRIASKLPRPSFSERAYRFEDAIMARQEVAWQD